MPAQSRTALSSTSVLCSANGRVRLTLALFSRQYRRLATGPGAKLAVSRWRSYVRSKWTPLIRSIGPAAVQKSVRYLFCGTFCYWALSWQSAEHAPFEGDTGFRACIPTNCRSPEKLSSLSADRETNGTVALRIYQTIAAFCHSHYRSLPRLELNKTTS